MTALDILTSSGNLYLARDRPFSKVLSHFGKYLGDQVKGRSPKELKSLIEVPYVAHLKIQVQILNMNLSLLRSVFLDRVIHFGKILGDQVKCRSPKKLKSLIEIPYLALLKVQFLSFNMNLIFSP